jgi:N6-L-threonylcarbamoyladenine synthase
MRILAIETSCDETALAVLDCDGIPDAPRFEVRAEVVATQIATHRPFGGVVPALAKREHINNLPIAYRDLCRAMGSDGDIPGIDKIAVTVGPGLEPALWAGINFAQELSARLTVPLVGINHLEGHLYSNWLDFDSAKKIVFPAVVLLVSGGHTALLIMHSMKDRALLGETQDDAAGEAFDKVAKMLRLPYPGGPEVERAAGEGNPNAIPFPRPMLHSGDYNFSFSGLKTSVLYHMRAHPEAALFDVCASFQKAACDVLVTKAMRAAEENGARSLLLCGGVAANSALRAAFKEAADKASIPFLAPAMRYNGDNAVMIAAAAYCGTAYPADRAMPSLNI